ncbi:hypothetical protein A6R68_04271 [Neotoma lepida]|uniref:Uncharacterized protein n=1 Tax=Neotoma lepida TaxID=56216 RepID=A0A1A6GMU6_NEOLE|nr:hypothetical protein A6R68_04271 [Neotoma lepida]
MLLHQTEPHLASHMGLLQPGPLYQNGVAGPGGQKYVVRVCRDASISPLNVLRHIFSDHLDARAHGFGRGPQNTEGVPMHGGRAEPGCLQFITSSKRSSRNLLAPHP